MVTGSSPVWRTIYSSIECLCLWQERVIEKFENWCYGSLPELALQRYRRMINMAIRKDEYLSRTGVRRTLIEVQDKRIGFDSLVMGQTIWWACEIQAKPFRSWFVCTTLYSILMNFRSELPANVHVRLDGIARYWSISFLVWNEP